MELTKKQKEAIETVYRRFVAGNKHTIIAGYA